MEQTGGFGPWPSDEVPPLGVVGAADAAEPIEVAEPIEAAEASEGAGDAWEPGDARDPADVGEPGDAWEPGDARDPADVGEPGDAWEPVDAGAGPGPKTGEPRVDAALARLDELAGRPVTEHRMVFEDVHRRLRDVLGELDTREPPESHDATRSESRAGR